LGGTLDTATTRGILSISAALRCGRNDAGRSVDGPIALLVEFRLIRPRRLAECMGTNF
jgi:hypothetical protein